MAASGVGAASRDERKSDPRAGTALARFCLTADAQDYLDHFDVQFYLSDAVAQLIRAKDAEPAKFMQTYFQSVLAGSNVVNREFAYLHANMRNRLAFVAHVSEAFSKVGRGDTGEEPWYTMNELAHLICLVCDDFPASLLDAAALILDVDPAGRSLPVNKGLQAVMVVFIFTEFFAEMYECTALADHYPPVAMAAGAGGSGTTAKSGASWKDLLPVPGRSYSFTGAARDRWPMRRTGSGDTGIGTTRLPKTVWSTLERRSTQATNCLWCPPVRLLRQLVSDSGHSRPATLQQLFRGVCSSAVIQSYIRKATNATLTMRKARDRGSAASGGASAAGSSRAGDSVPS